MIQGRLADRAYTGIVEMINTDGLAQITHLATEELPFALDPGKARRLRTVLADILTQIERIAYELGGRT